MSIGIDRVPLSQLLAANQASHLEPVVPFAAFRDEIPVIVVAVLERTAAYHAIGDRYDRGVIRLDRCFVDPTSVEWKAKAGDVENGQKKPGGAFRSYRSNAQPADQARVASDVRAIANRKQVQRQTELEHAQLAAQRAQPAVAIQAEEKTMPRGVNPRAVEERERLAAAGLKRCPKCKLEKPKDQFSATASYCRPCTALISAERTRGAAGTRRTAKPKRTASRKKRAGPLLVAAIPPETLGLGLGVPANVDPHAALVGILGDLQNLAAVRRDLVEKAMSILRAMVSA
ncbi:MAG TPA: hypothetical protein VGU71_22380 [Candidatus Dormibacteraeota bacterium]|nr:hypothetical protein [Candidatus Dormibacteraeota bacterium]